MSKKNAIFYSALLLTGVNLLLRLFSTGFQVYLSGRIGAAGIGLLQLVLSVGMLAMTAAMGGIRTATMYLCADAIGRRQPGILRKTLRSCVCYSLLFSFSVSMLLFLLAPRIANSWIGNGQVIGALRLYCVFLPISCLCGVMTGYFTAANRIGTLSCVEIAEQLCSMVVTVLSLWLYAGSDPAKACQSVILGSGVGACLTFLCLLFMSKLPPAGKPQPVVSKLLSAALPLALADNLKAGISTTENLMVPKRLSLYAGIADPLAAFGMVCGMVFPVLMFPAAILFSLAELLIPELARCAAAKSQMRIRYLTKQSLRVGLLYGCLLSGLMFLLSDKLCMLLYGSHEAGQYLKRFSLLIPMLYSDALTDAMTKGLGQQKVCVRYNILTSFLDVVFLFLLLPRYGMGGYYFSFLITHLLNFILSLQRLLKITKISLPLKKPVLTAVSAVIGVLSCGFLTNPWLSFLCYPIIFFCLLVLFGVVKKEDTTWIKGLIHKK